MTASGLQEVRTAAAWLERRPAGEPFVVFASPFGPAGILSAALKERTIRAGLPEGLQQRFHMYPGPLGETSPSVRPAMLRAILPYVRDARPYVRPGIPWLVLGAFEPVGYRALTDRLDQLNHLGGPTKLSLLGPGVLLANLSAQAGVSTPPIGDSFPGAIAAMAWAAAILALFGAAGVGWTRAIVGPAHPAVLFGLAPAVGAAALILVCVAASRAGLALDPPTAWILWAVTALAGFGAARLPA
jgi:hypothetical protein